jgi:hypothetical protein
MLPDAPALERTMKKLTLDIEQLTVEQFQIEPAAGDAKGTVLGHQVSDAYSDPCRFCPEMPITWTCE